MKRKRIMPSTKTHNDVKNGTNKARKRVTIMVKMGEDDRGI